MAKRRKMATLGDDYGLEITGADARLEGRTNAAVYGAPGTGKTALGATAPNSLIVDFENGAAATVKAVNPDARIVVVESMDELRSVFQYLHAGDHEFRSVVLDPVNEMQRMVMRNVISNYSSRRQYDDLPSMQDWGKALNDMTKMITAFRSLPMHTIVTAHSSIPEHEEDTVKPLVSGKSFGPFLEGAMDLLAYLHVEEGEDGEPVRRLVTEATPTIRAKNRGGKLPPVIDNPDLSEIFSLMES